MKVWLLTVAEPLPFDPGHPRLLRTGLLADVLAKRGVDVTWWTTNFRHVQKESRFAKTTAIQAADHLKIWCLDSRPYFRNKSIARIFANRDVVAEFKKHAPLEPAPDVLVASYPIPDLAEAGAEYAAARGIPSIVDIRDLWPDIWPTILPPMLRPLGNLALLPFYWQSRRALRRFSSICAITNDIVQWGLHRAGRPRTIRDRAFPLAYPEIVYAPSEEKLAQKYWARQFAALPETKLTLCFFGSIVNRSRIDVIVDAVRLLPENVRAQTKIVLCGEGEALDGLRVRAADLPQIIFPGWVTGPQIQALASMSDAGLLPYPSDEDFKRSIPNKTVEYLAHGLPVITSLSGPVSSLIEEEHCGMTYAETDPASLAHLIERLHAGPGDLNTMSRNASDVFRRRFNAKEVYGHMADMIQQTARHAADSD